MAFYDLKILSCPDVPATIKELRANSSLSIADLKRRIATQGIVLSVDSTDGPPDKFGKERISYQQDLFRTIADSLRRIGNEMCFQHRATDGSEPEAVSYQMLTNLMDSQLAYFDQEHD